MNEWNNVSCVCDRRRRKRRRWRSCGAESRGGRAQAISHGKLNGQVSAHKAKSLRRYGEL